MSSRAGSPGNYFVFFVDVDVLSFLSSAGAAAALQQRLGEIQTELRTKEEECSKAAQECDRLVKELADRHKAALQAAKDSETSLLVEYETERSAWAEMEKALNDGYGEIEDMTDGELSFLSFSRRPL